MVSVTLSIPSETKELMNKHSEMNWSGFVKKCIEEKARRLEEVDKLLKKAESERDVVDWSVKLQRASRSGRLAELKAKGLI